MLFAGVDIPPMSRRSIRNVTNQTELQTSVCQERKTPFKQEKSGAFRARRLCHFLEQMGHFVTNSIWVCVCERMCVIHWFFFIFFFLCIYRPQLPWLFVSKSDFVVKDPLMPSRVQASFFPLPCANTSIMCVHAARACVFVHRTCRVQAEYISFFFLPFSQVCVLRRYAPGNSADSALGVWTLSVSAAEEEEVPCRAEPRRPVPCCAWRHVPDWQTQSEEAAAGPDLWR